MAEPDKYTVCGICRDVVCDAVCDNCGEPVPLLSLADEYIRLRDLAKEQKAVIEKSQSDDVS